MTFACKTRTFLSVAVAAFLTCASSSGAATFGYTTTQPILKGSFSALEGKCDPTVVCAVSFDFSGTLDEYDPTTFSDEPFLNFSGFIVPLDVFGDFTISSVADPFALPILSGALAKFDFDATSAALLFDTLGGTAGTLFGEQFLVEFFLGSSSGQEYGGDVTVSAIAMSTIPVPASLPLLLGAVGVLAVSRRRAVFK